MLVYCSYCVYNLFIKAGNRGRWPASVKLITLPYLTLTLTAYTRQRISTLRACLFKFTLFKSNAKLMCLYRMAHQQVEFTCFTQKFVELVYSYSLQFIVGFAAENISTSKSEMYHFVSRHPVACAYWQVRGLHAADDVQLPWQLERVHRTSQRRVPAL